MGLESLMHRWRLVYTACDRFKIVNGESIGIVHTVPSHYIKRMVGVGKVMQFSLFLYFNNEITLLIDCFQIYWTANISFTIRRMFQQLPKFITITAWSIYRTKRF